MALPPPFYGQQLMTDRERERLREQLEDAATEQERDRIRAEHRTQMQERARRRYREGSAISGVCKITL